MKKLILLLLLFSSFLTSCSHSPSHSPSQNNLPIIWKKDYKLTWKDFKGTVPDGPSRDAQTWAKIDISKIFQSDSEFISVIACFSPEISWVKPEVANQVDKVKSNYLLNHEQRHFDIGEVFCRMERKMFSEWKTTDTLRRESELSNFIDAKKDSFNLVLGNLEKEYDEETNHSLNEVEQNNWNFRIDSLLNVYKDYEKHEVKVLARSDSRYDGSYSR